MYSTTSAANNYNGQLQKPLLSPFNAHSTASEVIEGIDLSGKVAIVTGGNTGIGLETTKALASAGAKVIVPARDTEKAKKNLNDVPGVEIVSMDLSDPESVDRFAKQFISSGSALHLLINNAGIMWMPLRRNGKGIELHLATNYLSLFQLTARLWTALKRANGARVVNVSSQGHQFAPFNFSDPNFEQTEYDMLKAYGQSKTAVNLFTVELDERAKLYNTRAYSLHPGSIHGTELGREAPVELFQQMGFYDESGNIVPEVLATLKNIQQGAATTTWCATSELLHNIGGVYCEDANIARIAAGTQQGAGGVMPYSLDEQNAKRLWSLTEELTGIHFDVR